MQRQPDAGLDDLPVSVQTIPFSNG
jgi:hypothetical protein